jgi:glycosyltransferase involved in cell wall biosynthesis
MAEFAICILTNDFPPSYGGLGVHVGELYKHLKRDYRLILVIKKNKHDTYLVQDGLRFNRFKDGEALLEHLETLGIDLIHNHTINQSMFKKGIATKLKEQLSIPMIYTCHSLLAHELAILEKYDIVRDADTISQEEIMQNSDKIIVLSEPSKKMLLKYYPKYRQKMIVIPNGISTNQFKRIRQKKRIKNIFYAGRLVKEKGVVELCTAFSNLEKNNLCLHIFGQDFSYDKKIETKMKQTLQSRKNKAKFHGWKDRNKMLRFLRRMDLMVLPSYHETLPFAVLEAMAAGVPVICTKIQNLDELFIKKNLAVPVEPKSSKSIESAIKFSISNLDGMNQMATLAQKEIKKHYSWDNLMQNYKKLYDSMINQ